MATVYIGDIPEDVRQRDVEDFFRDYKELVVFIGITRVLGRI